MPYKQIQHLAHVPEETTILFDLSEQEQNPIQGYINTCHYRNCKKEFRAKTSRKKYCNDNCKMNEHYERKKES